MKYIFLALLAVMLIPSTPLIFAPPDASPQDKFNAADVILTGKIIGFYQPNPPENVLSSLDTIYDVKVDTYVKNPQEQNILSVIARGGPDAEMEPRSGNVNYDVDDLVYLFLREDSDNGMYRINPFSSYRIDVECEPVPDELSHLTGKPSDWEFQTTNSDKNEKKVFAINEKVIIRFDATNTTPITNTMTYDIVIHDGKNKDNRTTFYSESKEITLPACVGHAILEWSFVPTKVMDYFVDVRNDGRGIGFGFLVTEDGKYPFDYYDQPVVEHSVLKQHKMKIPDDELMCKSSGTVLAFRNDGRPACLEPDTLAKFLERGLIGKKSYIPTPDLNLFGKKSSSEIAFDAAQQFVDSSKTVMFDKSERSGGFSNLANKKDSSHYTYLLEGDFVTNTGGYGDRTNQEYLEEKTRHKIVVKVDGPDVVYAVIDNQWDEINQEFIAQRSEDFKDFEVRYQKFFGGEQRDYHIQLDSRPGLMRITESPDDAFFIVEHLKFEEFWNAIIQNNFFDVQHDAEHCEECIYHSLKIESGGTHNTVTWIEGDTIDIRLYNVVSALEEIAQNQEDGWPT